MIRTYLDWLIAVPWSKRSEETLDPTGAREVLDADHAGLEDVKDRIVEYLAVRKLRQDRGIPNDKRSGAILTLIGPPGTGKTSIGESVARALNREFVRMSLGGVRDEAEIRGHRRTYIGSLPGRLVRALRDAGTMNPVILLDEVDKVGADWRGDPSAALLEVLDPAQNHSFRDHYLDVELDLSEVVLHRDRQRRRHDPRCAARPDGGHPLRRLHRGREDGDRARLPLAAAGRTERAARGRGLGRATTSLQTVDLRVHARGRRPPARARARDDPPQDGDADRGGAGRGARRGRHRRRARRARPPEGVPGGCGADRGSRCRDRPRRHRHRRRRPLRRGDLDGRRQRPPPHRPARRGDEGVRAHRALVRPLARRRARRRGRRLQGPLLPRARAGRRDPEGRSERRDHDGDRTRVAPVGAAREAHGRDDRRGDAAGTRPTDRRPEAEGARRARGRADRRDHPRAEPRRPRRRPRGRAPGDASSIRL